MAYPLIRACLYPLRRTQSARYILSFGPFFVALSPWDPCIVCHQRRSGRHPVPEYVIMIHSAHTVDWTGTRSCVGAAVSLTDPFEPHEPLRWFEM